MTQQSASAGFAAYLDNTVKVPLLLGISNKTVTRARPQQAFRAHGKDLLRQVNVVNPQGPTVLPLLSITCAILS